MLVTGSVDNTAIVWDILKGNYGNVCIYMYMIQNSEVYSSQRLLSIQL